VRAQRFAQLADASGGDLDRVVRMLRLEGSLLCVPDFVDHVDVQIVASTRAAGSPASPVPAAPPAAGSVRVNLRPHGPAHRWNAGEIHSD
jgi:hypothetical protein